MQDLIFDSWALMALFDDESSADAVSGLLQQTDKHRNYKFITVVNLGEIWYNYARIYSDNFANELIDKVQEMNFRIVPVDWQLTQIAAQFKVPGGISYADCFAAALAKSQNAPLVTGDREFERLADDIEILWV